MIVGSIFKSGEGDIYWNICIYLNKSTFQKLGHLTCNVILRLNLKEVITGKFIECCHN